MVNDVVDPFGRARASKRLSDEETAKRMLETATLAVRNQQLAVTLELPSYEDIIVEAQVVRSTVYRRWPTKGHFYADLFRSLAHDTETLSSLAMVPMLARSREIVHADPTLLKTAHGRRTVQSEVVRHTAGAYIEHHSKTTAWSTEVALTALVDSLPHNAEVRAELSQGLRSFYDRSVEFLTAYVQVHSEVLGFASRFESGDQSFVGPARLLVSANDGYAFGAINHHADQLPTLQADPLKTGELKDWDLVALNHASIINTMIVQHDRSDWTEEEIARRLEVFDAATARLTAVLEG